METKTEMEYYPRKDMKEIGQGTGFELKTPKQLKKIPVVVDRKIYKNPLYKEGMNPKLEYIWIEKKIYVKTPAWF